MPNGNQYQPTTARRSPHIASAEASNNPKIQQPGRNNLIKHCANQPALPSAKLAISIGDPKKPPFITINTGGGAGAEARSRGAYIFPSPHKFSPTVPPAPLIANSIRDCGPDKKMGELC